MKVTYNSHSKPSFKDHFDCLHVKRWNVHHSHHALKKQNEITWQFSGKRNTPQTKVLVLRQNGTSCFFECQMFLDTFKFLHPFLAIDSLFLSLRPYQNYQNRLIVSDLICQTVFDHLENVQCELDKIKIGIGVTLHNPQCIAFVLR